MLIAYRYRLYPDKSQTELLNKHFGSVRYIYNWALGIKTQAFQRGRPAVESRTISRFELDKQMTALKAELDWLKEINSQCLQAALRNLDSAYTRFFREKKGFPRFKSKKDNRHSFQCPQNVKVDFVRSTIQLPKIGKVKAVFSREFMGEVKTVTVSKTATGKVFASVLVDTPDTLPVKSAPNQAVAVGIDVGLKDFATLSTGEVIANPRFLKKSIKKLKRLSRQHSKKKKGSRNRNKSRIRLARQHEKVTNQRNDFLHKTSTVITKQYGTICVENLNISGMMKNHKLARTIADVSWGSFVSMLEYKCDWQGKNLVKIGRFEPSSKLCTCGTLNHALSLKDRVWTCGSCGTTHDRDLLAANNIVRFAFVKQNLVGLDKPEFTLDETDSSWSLTQESPAL